MIRRPFPRWTALRSHSGPFFAGLGLVLALVVTGIAAQASFDAQKQSAPPHVAPPAAEVTAPPPLSAVGGDSTAALEVEYRAFVEGVQREQERLAAEEAERVAAVERARRQQGAGSRAGSGSPCDDDEWECLRQCEAGGNYGANTGNGFYGAYQFLPSTWSGAVSAAGHAEYADGLPSDAPPEVQDAAARHLQSVRGWQPWPGCSAKLGLR